jgi:hypothetical protein
MHGTPGDEVPTDPYEWLARLSLSAYQAPESAVRAISERLASTRERRDVEQEKRGRRSVSGWPSLDLPFIESDDIRADRRASNRERRSRLAAESQNLQRLDLEVTAHIRDLKSWEETRTAEPNILRMTLAGLGAIFSMSVLLPLVLLPQPSQSSNPTIHAHGITEKALTLVPLAVGFYGLLLMLDRVMHGMKPDSSTLVAVRYYQTKDVYSPYLDIGDSARSGGVGGSAGP